MRNKSTELWRCEQCLEIHDNEDDARECCRPDVTAGYGCLECGLFFLNEIGAEKCCSDSDADPAAPPILNRFELEAAGQQRLFG
ncbi:MAG: hypothetical protein PHQ05_10205 [Sterolibacterium sp.]|nr:hypothetical protein [Sterolibacterium sp.]